ncbi:DUF6365 family protein [Gymnodinialimonas sp.]
MDIAFYFQPTGVPSYGEMQQAIGFSRDLTAAGYRCWFVAPERLSGQLALARLSVVTFDSMELAEEVIEDLDPALIIACEIFGMSDETVAFLDGLGRPLATIDGTGMGREIASDPFHLPKYARPLGLPAGLKYLRVCPVHDQQPNTDQLFHWAGYPGAARSEKSAEKYEAMGLDPERKTVLLAIASWAHHFADLPEPPFDSLVGYHDALVTRLAEAFEAWETPVQLAVVSHKLPMVFFDGEVSVKGLGILHYDLFDHLLASCDLIVSDNIIQASVTRAIVAGTPHLIVENKAADRLPYPSNVFPLAQVFPDDRAYTKTIDRVELTDDAGLRHAVRQIAEKGFADPECAAARARYVEGLAALDKPADIVRAIVGQAEPLTLEPRDLGRPNRDVVFYIEIWFSFGEREHALSLARYLQSAGYRPRFVVHHKIAEHIRSAGFEPVPFYSPLLGVQRVRQIAPALIIGCELFNLTDLSMKGLSALDIPIATIDGTSLGVEINTDPFLHPKLTRDLNLPSELPRFRPAPVNDVQGADPLNCHFNLFPDIAPQPKDAEIYRDLGLDPSRKTILLPIALWAVTGSMLFELVHYHKLLVDRVVQALDKIEIGVDLLVVGLQDEGVEAQGCVAQHVFPLLPYPQFDHVLMSCDLVISDNIIQTSVSKAFAMNKPHLVLQNLDPSEVPFQSNIFPLKLLFPADREYAQAVEVAEFGDVDEIEERLRDILTKGYSDSARKARREAYLERLAQLPSPAGVVDHIIGAQGATSPSRKSST